jgi:hypothetical protein
VLPYRSWDLTEPPDERIYKAAAAGEITATHSTAILAYISSVTHGLFGSVVLQDLGTPADVEVVLTSETGARVAKTRTNSAGHFTVLPLRAPTISFSPVRLCIRWKSQSPSPPSRLYRSPSAAIHGTS